ncbi:MAG TPA: hypothetical protein VFV94_00535 [Polyangiaceae bacterium]|jgi:hypothetical protein|nr:hypothetical protein [Polyangiaceae bacterium]
MRPTRAQFFVSITLSFGTLHCSNAGDTLPVGTGNATNHESAGHAGMTATTAGSGGTLASTAGSGGSNSVGNGGTGGSGGSAGSAAGAGGTLGGGSGSSGSSGASSLGSGTGGGGPAGMGGRDAGGSGRGFGGMGVGMGGMNGGTGPTSGGSSSGGSGGAGGLYQAVLDVIGANCATKDCHVNMKGQHVNLHNTDGKLYERLVSTTMTITGAAGACAKDPVVIPGDPDNSLIIKMIIEDDSGRKDCGKRMPDDCPDPQKKIVCLTDPQIDVIRSWIAAGAPQ